MSVSAAQVVRALAIIDVPLVAQVVQMIGNSRDVGIGEGIEMVPRLPIVARPLDDVKQMRNDTGRAKSLAVVVEVDPPGIAGSLGEDLELMLERMIAPDAGIDGNALVIRRTRLADFRMREDAVAAIEPAVRPPDEGVQGFVRGDPHPP